MKKQRHLPPKALDGYIRERIRDKRAANRHNAADLYRTTGNWITQFQQGRLLYLHRITSGWIDRFIGFLQAAGLKPNTVNTYISNLRALYNQAVRDRLLTAPAESPFAHILLRRGKPVSRAIDAGNLRQLVTLPIDHPHLAPAIDYCTFSYLACGMPFIDLAHLTAHNIQGNELVYRRHKTGTLIRIGLTQGMHHLIRKYADSASPYLFPILPVGHSVKHEEYKALLRRYNRELKLLGESLRLPVPLTSYVFRHTWATEALRKHTPIAVISQALGHTSEKTTRFYLASIEQAEMNRMNERVVGEVDRLVITESDRLVVSELDCLRVTKGFT